MSEHEHQSTGRQLEESAPEIYEQYLVPPVLAPWADRLLDRVELQRGDSVLDVGCGTGIVARRVASHVDDRANVVGIDVNEGVLDGPERWPPRVDRRSNGGGEKPPTAALREMHRVLVPDGRVAVSVWRPLEFNPGYLELAKAPKEHVGDDAEATTGSPFPEWSREDLHTRARKAELREPSIAIEIGSMRYPSAGEFVRREAASSPLSEPLGDLAQAARETLVREVEYALREYADDDGIAFPMESHVLTAQR